MNETGCTVLENASAEHIDDSVPQTFQISIRIIEAKHLAGIDLDPFVKVIVGKEEKQTKTKRSTAAPTFEEDFFFDFSLPAAVFFDQVIKLQVFSAARLFRRRKLVGEFQIDVATVYHQPGHYFFEKWALIVSPTDPLSPPNGYVLCSIIITRPQEVPKLPHSRRDVMEEDDIENDLLIPDTFAGWPGDRDPAHYVVTIYKAEDLPNSAGMGITASMKKALKSDSETTNFVDPCVTVAFAGIQAKTNVISNCADPEWNEQITFCEMFPTFSQSIRIHVRDAHQGVISTVLLDFKIISDNSIEEGYAPTFGPSYVNLYGSFRGNIDPSPMNFALAEGVAYRGRLLMSVDVHELRHEKKKVTLHKVAKKSTKFGPETFNDTKEKFFLFCCILEANMLDKRLDGRSVHFELSIGKYGTMEYSNECARRHVSGRKNSTSKVSISSDGDTEDSIPLLREPSESRNPYETVIEDEDGCRWRSCTTPMVAIADDHYCSIPYEVDKPCTFITSQWEDYTYRYAHINQLSHVTKCFERKLADVERALEMALDSEARRRLRSACDTLISLCSEYVSHLESELFQDDMWYTELDKKKNKQRKIQIEQITRWCRDFRLRVMDPSNELKLLLDEAVVQSHAVKVLSSEAQEVMPDIFLWLICGNRRVAYRRFKPYDLFYSFNRQERGVDCGTVRGFFLKVPGSSSGVDEDKYSIWGHVTAYLWLGPMADRDRYLDGLPKTCKPVGTRKELESDYHTPAHLHYKEVHTYELRCHIYQGRSLMASDESGLSDPFVRVVLGGRVQQTQIIEQSVNPIWDECLIMPRVDLLGSTKFVKENPPTIIIQVYDYDENIPHDFIGLAEAQPLVKLDHEPYSAPNFPARLRWYPLHKGGHRVGEILAAFELIQLHKEMIDYPPAPSTEDTEAGPIVPVPRGIRPKLSKHQLQVMFWGIRDLDKGGILKKVKPVIEIECAGMVLESDPIDDYSKHHNFGTLIKMMDVDLPDEPVYQPPVIIRCVEKKSFGRSTLFGSTTIPSLSALVQRDEDADEDASELIGLDDEETQNTVNESDGDPERRTDDQSVLSYQRSLLAASDPEQSGEESPGDSADHLEVDDLGTLEIIDEEDHQTKAKRRSSQAVSSMTSRRMSSVIEYMEGYDNETFEGENGTDERKESGNFPATVDRRPTIGALSDGRRGTAPPENQPERRHPARLRARRKQDEVLDWWSKYYASIQVQEQKATRTDKLKVIGNQAFKKVKKTATKFAKKVVDVSTSNEKAAKRKRKYRRKTEAVEDDPMELVRSMDIAKLTLYRHELEHQPEFDHFWDCFNIYPMYKGRKTFADFDDGSRIVGKFKGRLRVFKHPLPLDLPSPFPDITNGKQELIVRVYIIRAHSLMAQDFNGLADPYLVVNVGKKKISDRSHRIYGQLNPTFGRMFEFNACLPEDYELLVQVWDWDRVTRDDLIGETKIDIEQRFYSKHRATCGLPIKYDDLGYNSWRDCQKPSQILRDLCQRYSLPDPTYQQDGVTVADKTFSVPKTVKFISKEVKNDQKEERNQDDEKEAPIDMEQLALLALHNVQDVPEIGHRLVPEHVEFRTLYLPGKPGLTQGTLEMWVDMFPKEAVHIPEPVDIKPRKTKSYELRVVIYDTKDVILDDYNILTGLSTVDQYLKGFIAGPDIDGQETDTHYRSLSGEGNFNWRFVFRFEYSDIDNKIIYKTKYSPLSLTEHEEKIPPALHLQVWDADEITSDDYLGEIVFNLTKIPRGAKSAGSCAAKVLKNSETINLFAKNSRRVRAWWPFIRREPDGAELLAGKVDLSFELLTEEDAARKPAGRGHDPPDALPEPVRPETSFAWFTSPLKFLKYTVWLGMRWRMLVCFLVFLLIIFILVFIYELPRAGAGKLVGWSSGS